MTDDVDYIAERVDDLAGDAQRWLFERLDRLAARVGQERIDGLVRTRLGRAVHEDYAKWKARQ